jgi:hypothetical protein
MHLTSEIMSRPSMYLPPLSSRSKTSFLLSNRQHQRVVAIKYLSGPSANRRKRGGSGDSKHDDGASSKFKKPRARQSGSWIEPHY